MVLITQCDNDNDDDDDEDERVEKTITKCKFRLKL